MRPVTLLHPRIVVLVVGSTASEEHGPLSLCQIHHQVVVDELASVVTVQAQQRERQALFEIANLRQRSALAPILQRPQFGPVGTDVHSVEHPQVQIIETATAQGYGVHLQPAGPLFGPGTPDGNALTQQAPRPSAAPPGQAYAQGRNQPVQRSRAGLQQTLPQVRINWPMVLLIGRQPFGQQRMEPAAARLETH